MLHAPIKEPTTERPHPGGARGAMLSLDEVAKMAWRSRGKPRLRAWVLQKLRACGNPTGARGQMQCVLDAFRDKVPYVSDPVQVEFLASPENLLCLDDDGGLCVPGGDCDESAATLTAAAMTIGRRAWIVGASYNDAARPTHVYAAFEDDAGERVRVDGTTDYAVGNVHPYVREWWVDPAVGVRSDGLSGGDFVAVGKAASIMSDNQSLHRGGRVVRGFGSDGSLADVVVASQCAPCSRTATFILGAAVGAAALLVYPTVRTWM